MKIKVCLDGCDDSTYFEIEVNEKERKLVEKMCELSEESSTYGCMPTMCIED